MKLYKESFGVLLKNRILWFVIITYNLINVIRICLYSDIGAEVSILKYTKEIVLLSPQILILYLIISYEFISMQYRENIEECCSITLKGYGRKIEISQIKVMISVLLFNYITLSFFALFLTYKAFNVNGITDIDYLAGKHIIWCLFVNIFLIGLIGILLGALISRIKKRMWGYVIIMIVVLITSYLLTEISTMIMVLSDYSINLFSYLDILNIITPGLNFKTNDALGFPIMTYRVFLIIFWNAFLFLVILVRNSQKKICTKTIICGLICIITFVGYALPSSRIDMSFNSKGSAMADQHYYGVEEYRIDEQNANFKVDQYIMKFEIKRLLEAQVKMVVSDILSEYKFTLSHSYNVESVSDENGNKMPFEHKGDALIIYNKNSGTDTIIIKYNGSNEAYYANTQGINLHGSFPYYPIPGFHQITDDGVFMNQVFLEKEAYFDIVVETKKKVYSNLNECKKNHFMGESNGVTLLSGLYNQQEKNDIRIVYPPLMGWNEKDINMVISAAEKGGYSGCTIFITPNMNRQDDALNSEQIITRNYFENVEMLRDNYPI